MLQLKFMQMWELLASNGLAIGAVADYEVQNCQSSRKAPLEN